MNEKPTTREHWNQRYFNRDVPWDSGIISRELSRVLEEQSVWPCKAFELGCGTGTNSIHLAQRGFEVFAADVSPVAIEGAQKLAADANVKAHFVASDLCRLDHVREALAASTAECERQCSFLFDRGCYHCARRQDLPGFLKTIDWLAAPDAQLLLLCGNANEQTEHGPPRLTEIEIRSEWEPLFTIEWIREFRFEDRGGIPGPLGWSCWMTRRPERR